MTTTTADVLEALDAWGLEQAPDVATVTGADRPGVDHGLDKVNHAAQSLEDRRRDLRFPISHLTIGERPWIVEVRDGGCLPVTIPLTAAAQTQLLQRLGMPVTYFKRAGRARLGLYRDHFHYWAQQARGDVVFRTWDGVAHGVVTPRYTRLDHSRLARSLLDMVAHTTIETSLFHVSPGFFQVRLVFPETRRRVGNLGNGMPDNFMGAVDICNSETGSRAFSISSLLLRLVCTNGLWSPTREAVYTCRHVGDQADLEQIVAEQVREKSQRSLDLALSLHGQRDHEVPKTDQVLESLAEEWGLSQAMVEQLKVIQASHEPNGAGVINTITRAARSLENPDARLDLEARAGGLLEMRAQDWARLVTVEN